MNQSSRPSLDLPREIFKAIIAVEDSARDAATYYAEMQLGAGTAPQGAAAEYMRRVVATGVKRDELAALLLPRLVENAPELVMVPLVGTAS